MYTKEGLRLCHTISYKSQLSNSTCLQKSFCGTKMPSSGWLNWWLLSIFTYSSSTLFNNFMFPGRNDCAYINYFWLHWAKIWALLDKSNIPICTLFLSRQHGFSSCFQMQGTFPHPVFNLFQHLLSPSYWWKLTNYKEHLLENNVQKKWSICTVF